MRDRATAIGNVHRKFGEVRPCGFRVTRSDRQIRHIGYSSPCLSALVLASVNTVLTYVDVRSRAADCGKRRHRSTGTVVFRLTRSERVQSTAVTLSRLLTTYTVHIAHTHNRSQMVRCSVASEAVYKRGEGSVRQEAPEKFWPPVCTMGPNKSQQRVAHLTCGTLQNWNARAFCYTNAWLCVGIVWSKEIFYSFIVRLYIRSAPQNPGKKWRQEGLAVAIARDDPLPSSTRNPGIIPSDDPGEALSVSSKDIHLSKHAKVSVIHCTL